MSLTTEVKELAGRPPGGSREDLPPGPFRLLEAPTLLALPPLRPTSKAQGSVFSLSPSLRPPLPSYMSSH